MSQSHKLLRIVNDGRNKIVFYLDAEKGRQSKKFPLNTANAEIQAFITAGKTDETDDGEKDDDSTKKNSKAKTDETDDGKTA